MRAKKETSGFKKLTAAVIFLLILEGLSVSLTVYNMTYVQPEKQSPLFLDGISTQLRVSKASLEKSCDYLIFTEATNIYMQNCDTGTVQFSSTNAAEVINDVIGNLTSGGEVFIKAGIYEIASTINLASNTRLIGEGDSSILQMSTTSDYALIQAYKIQNATVEDLHLAGNAPIATGSGLTNELVYIYGSRRIQVLDSIFTQGYSYGVYAVGHSNDITVRGNTFAHCLADSINFSAVTGGLITENNVGWGSDYGITVNTGSHFVTVSNNVVHDISLTLSSPHYTTNSWACLALQNVYYSNMSDISFIGNQVWNCPGYGFEMTRNSRSYDVGTLISGNDFYNVGYGAIIYKSDFTTIRDNVFNLTRNTAIETATSSANHLKITGNTIERVTGQGIALNGIPNVDISENTFWDTGLSAIYNVSPASQNVNIQDNSFESIGNTIIQSTAGGYWQIIDNRIVGNHAYAGIYLLTAVSHVLIQGNYITQATVGVDCARGASFIMIVDNIAINELTAGIWAETGSSHISIIGNDVSTGDSVPVAEAGTFDVIQYNQGYNPLGALTNPFDRTNNLVRDSICAAHCTKGSWSTPNNGTITTVWGSGKTITAVVNGSWTGTHTYVLTIDGTQIVSIASYNPVVGTILFSRYFAPGEDFSIQCPADVTFYVEGS
jgi:hypothetical protein